MDLSELLALDFRPADLGDTADQFANRLEYAVASAVARRDATPGQQEAGARYLLLSAQLRQMVRSAERLKSASGSEIEQGLGIRLAELRAQQAEQLTLSGLYPAAQPRRGSISVPVEVSF
ncbi:hypothetical protein ACI3L1_06695 [Deinococcus sp. SM5_A1]|uniref:hypothetical protein n=1 Tax=Deinococcus sp. SM5_A1 TaxID=3379094 RepID=UPI00385DB98B